MNLIPLSTCSHTHTYQHSDTRLVRENKRLAQEVQELRASADESISNRRVMRLQKDVLHLTRDRAESMSAMVQMTQELTSFRKENADLKHHVDSMTKNLQSLQAENEQFLDEIARRDEEISRQDRELCDWEQRCQELSSKMSTMESNLRSKIRALELELSRKSEPLAVPEDKDDAKKTRGMTRQQTGVTNMSSNRMSEAQNSRRRRSIWNIFNFGISRLESGCGDEVIDDIGLGAEGTLIPQFCHESLRHIHSTESAHNGAAVQYIEFSVCGSNLLTTGADQCIRVWNDAYEMQSMLRHGGGGAPRTENVNGKLTRAYFSHDGTHILGCDLSVHLWRVDTGRCAKVLTGHTGLVTSAAFLSESNQNAVTGAHDRTVKLWDLERGSCVRTFLCTSNCNDVEVFRSVGNGPVGVSCHSNRTISFWDMRSPYTALHSIKEIGQQLSLSVSGCGNMVASNSRDNVLHVFDTRTYKLLFRLTNSSHSNSGQQYSTHLMQQAKLRFTPDSTRVVSGGSDDGCVFVWDISRASEPGTEPHEKPLIINTFSGDNPSTDGTREVLSTVTAVSFAGNKGIMACSRSDGSVHYYNYCRNT